MALALLQATLQLSTLPERLKANVFAPMSVWPSKLGSNSSTRCSCHHAVMLLSLLRRCLDLWVW